MKALSFSEALEHLSEREANYYDLTVPVSGVRMNEDGTMRFGDLDDVRLQEQALITLSNRIGVQAGYLKRCSGNLIDLRASNVNRWLETLPKKKSFFIRMDGEECRAVLSSAYRPMDHLELLDRFNSLYLHSADDLRVNLEIDEISMLAQVYWQSQEYTIRHKEPGDVSHLGIHIGNSEVGFHSVEFAAYIYRLVCTNGMIVGEEAFSYRRTHLFGLKEIDDLLEEGIPVILEGLSKTGDLFRRSMDIEVKNPVLELEHLFDRYKLSKDHRSLVMLHFQLNPDWTLFGLINAFTGAATEENLSVETRQTLQRIGGKLLSSTHNGWTSSHTSHFMD